MAARPRNRTVAARPRNRTVAARPRNRTVAAPPAAGPVAAPKVPAIAEEELPGGVRALIARHGGIPLVEFRLAFALPASEVTMPAAASVLCRSLFAGTEQHDRMGLAEALEDLGGHLDAAVHDDYLVLSGSVLAANLSPFLSLVAEMLTAPTYPENEVRADAARAADEALIVLAQPEVVARQALRRRMFRGHPYATPIASPRALRRVDEATLRELHHSLLSTSAPVLIIVGDVRPAGASAMLAEFLGPWLAIGKTPVDGLAPLPAYGQRPIEVVARANAVQSNVRLGGAAPSLSAPDWPATALAESIAGGMFSSRIVANLRERNGYTYSPQTVTRHGSLTWLWRRRSLLK